MYLGQGLLFKLQIRTSGFVKGYIDENNISINNAEIKRLVKGYIGVKRTLDPFITPPPKGQIVVHRIWRYMILRPIEAC